MHGTTRTWRTALALGCALAVATAGLLIWMSGPAAWAGDTGGDPKTREETACTVEILDDTPAYWAKEYYPRNWKLLVTASHPMVADGEPDGQGFKYRWSYEGNPAGEDGDPFAPNDTTTNLNIGGSGGFGEVHKTAYTDTQKQITPAGKKDHYKVHCLYYKGDLSADDIDGDTDPPPLNITRPDDGVANKQSIQFTTPRVTYVRSGGQWNPSRVELLNDSISYAIKDQFGDSIAESDRGNKHWIHKEQVPWYSASTKIKTYLDSIPTTETWEASPTEAQGAFKDTLEIRPFVVCFWEEGLKAGDTVVRVDPHPWWVGVGDTGRLDNEQEQICENRCEITLVYYHEGLNAVTIQWQVRYNVTLK